MNSSTPVYNFQDNVNLLASVMMLIVGVFGVFCNGAIVFIFYKESSERTAFNLICVFRALISAYILIFAFLSIFLVSTVLGFSLFSNYVDSFLINSSLTFYVGNEYQIGIIAVNRFVSLFFPFSYQTYFGLKPTFLVLIVFYGYRIIESIYMLHFVLPDKCYTLFYLNDLSWSFNFEPRCQFDNGAFDGALMIFVSMTLLNAVTFCRILWFYKSGTNQSDETKKRAKRNALLFLQTVLQDSLYLIDLTFTFKLRFIMLMFNERLSLLKKRLGSPTESTVVRRQNTGNKIRSTLPCLA